VINEEAPTNSVGTGAETALPPTHEPAGFTRLTNKRPKKRRKYVASMRDMISTDLGESTHDQGRYLPYKVVYDGQTDFIIYAKSEGEAKIMLRKAYRPEMMKKITVQRLYPNEVIKYFYDKRMDVIRGNTPAR
jgi:hypothetical protein